MLKIDDVGEFIPDAKKHLNTPNQGAIALKQTAPDVASSVHLKTLWPEPDWIALASRVGNELTARLFTIYKGLAKSPNVHMFRHRGISSEMLTQAYILSVETMKFFFEQCDSHDMLNRYQISEFPSQINAKVSTKIGVKFEFQFGEFAASPIIRSKVSNSMGENGKKQRRSKLLTALNWPWDVKDSEVKFEVIGLKGSSEGKTYWYVGLVRGSRFTHSFPDNFDTYEDAVRWLKQDIISKRVDIDKAAKPKPYVFKKNLASLIDCEPRNIIPDVLMTDFAFRGVQFGNWLTQPERQRFVDNTYIALMSLCEITGIDHEHVGRGLLGIAFGARGKSSASAHFEHNLAVINLTKTNGPGSIAHEWAHFFDFLLGTIDTVEGGMFSENHSRHYFSEASAEISHFNNLLDSVLSLESFQSKSWALDNQSGTRKHWSTAGFAGKVYWSRPSELLARAFEAFIQDEISARGYQCSWLATGTMIEEFSGSNPGLFPYPEGMERKLSNQAFAKFFAGNSA